MKRAIIPVAIAGHRGGDLVGGAPACADPGADRHRGRQRSRGRQQDHRPHRDPGGGRRAERQGRRLDCRARSGGAARRPGRGRRRHRAGSRQCPAVGSPDRVAGTYPAHQGQPGGRAGGAGRSPVAAGAGASGADPGSTTAVASPGGADSGGDGQSPGQLQPHPAAGRKGTSTRRKTWSRRTPISTPPRPTSRRPKPALRRPTVPWRRRRPGPRRPSGRGGRAGRAGGRPAGGKASRRTEAADRRAARCRGAGRKPMRLPPPHASARPGFSRRRTAS